MNDFEKLLHTPSEIEERDQLLYFAEKEGYQPPVEGTEQEKWDYYYKSLEIDGISFYNESLENIATKV